MEQDTNNKAASEEKQGFWSKKRFLQIGALSLSLIVCALIIAFRDHIVALEAYGYLGAFLVPLLCCATIIVPVPGLIVVFTLGAVLNPLLVGIISGVGGTLGETTGYLLGYGGRAAIENMALYRRVENWMRRWAPLTLFVLALIPNPIFDIAGAAAGALRVPFWKYLLYGGAGRLIKHTIFAFAGAWGLKSVLPLIK